jgi:hypothetical protein
MNAVKSENELKKENDRRKKKERKRPVFVNVRKSFKIMALPSGGGGGCSIAWHAMSPV